MTRPGRLTALAASAVLLLGGCGLELQDVPMPRLVSGPTYEVTAEFASALNLPLDAPVKLDGATVGQVSAITATDWHARVAMAITDDVALPEGVTAEIRLTSPMGVAFVDLTTPRGQDTAGGVLDDGALIPLSATSTAPDVSDLLSALSTLVTGGSFGDISTIVDELNVALADGTGGARRLLRRLESTATNVNARFDTVDELIRDADRLTAALARDRSVLTEALDTLGPAVATLNRQRESVMTLLGELRAFDATATPVVQQVRGDLVGTSTSLRTVLASLQRTTTDLTGVMEGLIAFAEGSGRASPGDFANFDLTFLLDPEALTRFRADDDPVDLPGAPRRPDGPPDELPQVLDRVLGGLLGAIGGIRP